MHSFFISIISVGLFCSLQINGAVQLQKRITQRELNDICRINGWANGIHPNPLNCRRFVECSGSTNNPITTLMDCPPDLVYDKLIKTCQFARLVTCDTDPPTQPPRVLHEADICKERGWADGIHPDPFDCAKFVECVSHLTYTFDCPGRLNFDIIKKVCRNPSEAVCDTNTNP